MHPDGGSASYEFGLDVYALYAGSHAAVERFLSHFAPVHPKLAQDTVVQVYGDVLAEPTLSFLEKARIITAMLRATSVSGAALDFHAAALRHHAGADAAVAAMLALGEKIAAHNFASSEISEPNLLLDFLLPDFLLPDFLLPALAAAAALGDCRQTLLKSLTSLAMTTLPEAQAKICYTLSLVRVYAGFPAAIGATVAIKDWLK